MRRPSHGQPKPKHLLLLVASLCVACGRDATGTAATTFSGVYSITQTLQAGICAPLPLPQPAAVDTGQYVVVPMSTSSALYRARVQQSGSLISLTPLDAQGQAQPGRAFTGTVNGSAVVATLGPVTRTEGPRAGGHVFSVTEAGQANGTFFTEPLLPPSSGYAAMEHTQARTTYVFKDSGGSNSVFTTCSVSDTTVGQKIGP